MPRFKTVASLIKYYKPVSRILLSRQVGMAIIYLSSQLLERINLPTHQLGRAALSRLYRCADLCGISACKVYPSIMLPLPIVSFYLTFSPSPDPLHKVERESSYFLWHCLSPTNRGPALHRYIALRCPDFPTQLTLNR